MAAAITRAVMFFQGCVRSVLLCALLAACLRAGAHPIVSTDINRHVSIHVADRALEIRYVYEMLEIAAINTARAWDADSDGTASPAERDAFAQSWSAGLVREIAVTLDEVPVPLEGRSWRWELAEGAFGLATWKLTALLATRLPVRTAIATLTYEDRMRPEEVGWKELVLTTGGTTGIAASNVPTRDLSYGLTDYESMSALPNPDQTRMRAVLRFAGMAPQEAPVAASPAQVRQPAPASAESRGTDRERASAAVPSAQPPQPSAPISAAPVPPAAQSPSHSEIASATSAGQGSPWHYYALPFFKLGVHHIATGFDHLVFLLGLMMFRQSVRRLILVVTAFTLAHSVTLALAATGLLHAPASAVEFLIAASIAYVGAITLLRPGSRHGPLLAMGFGLVHGLGFAAALGEALSGAAGRGWLVALASFNLGIEAFQLLLVLAVWPLLLALDRAKWGLTARQAVSCLVLLAGMAWMVQRVDVLVLL